LAVSKDALLMRLLFDRESVKPPHPDDRGFERKSMKILCHGGYS